MNKHFNIKVFGQVQGVNFRTMTKQQADNLGLVGFAKNEDKSCVYIEAEGDEQNLQELVAWCRAGAPWSTVERVEAGEGPLQNFKEFRIIRNFF